jgi:hypothetical protein
MTQPATEALPLQAVMMQLLFGKQVCYSLSGAARLGVADHMGSTASRRPAGRNLRNSSRLA